MGPPHPPGVTPGNLGGCLEEVVLEQSLKRRKIQTSEDTWQAGGGKGYICGYVWIWIWGYGPVWAKVWRLGWACLIQRHYGMMKKFFWLEQRMSKTKQRNMPVVVQSLSCVWLFATPWTAACQASLSFTFSQSLLKLLSIESMMSSNYLILCHPLLLLPSAFPSIRVFSSESALHIRWPEYWSFNFSISPFSEYSGLISFRMDWFNLAVQETLKSLLQHPTSKPSVLQHTVFFIVQHSHLFMTTGKAIALTIWTFVGKVTLKNGAEEKAWFYSFIYSFTWAVLRNLQDLSSLARDSTCTCCGGHSEQGILPSQPILFFFPTNS